MLKSFHGGLINIGVLKDISLSSDNTKRYKQCSSDNTERLTSNVFQFRQIRKSMLWYSVANFITDI